MCTAWPRFAAAKLSRLVPRQLALNLQQSSADRCALGTARRSDPTALDLSVRTASQASPRLVRLVRLFPAVIYRVRLDCADVRPLARDAAADRDTLAVEEVGPCALPDRLRQDRERRRGRRAQAGNAIAVRTLRPVPADRQTADAARAPVRRRRTTVDRPAALEPADARPTCLRPHEPARAHLRAADAARDQAQARDDRLIDVMPARCSCTVPNCMPLKPPSPAPMAPSRPCRRARAAP